MHFSAMYRLRWYRRAFQRHALWSVKQVRGGENKLFSGFKRQYLENGRIRPKLLHCVQKKTPTHIFFHISM